MEKTTNIEAFMTKKTRISSSGGPQKYGNHRAGVPESREIVEAVFTFPSFFPYLFSHMAVFLGNGDYREGLFNNFPENPPAKPPVTKS